MGTFALCLLALSWAGAGAARAQNKDAKDATATPAAGSRPWAKGVSPEQQRTAEELFQAGNALLKESLFPRAVEKYREALKHWDHPAIHYNMALAMLNLDNPVEVYHHLEQAMAYGAAPLDVEKFQHATSYKALIEKELAHVVISCQEAGATVTMDGNQLFTAPGSSDQLLRTGTHTIVASKSGYVATEITRKLPPGEVTKVELKLFTADDLVAHTRRWDAWKPWAVVGGGAALVLVGVLFTTQSQGAYNDFDTGVNDCGGCVPSADLESKRSSGDTFKTLSIVSYAVGGAALATGAVLLYLNRTQEVKINPAEKSVSLAPLLGPGIGGAVVVGRF